MIDASANKPPLRTWIAAATATLAVMLALGNLHRLPWLETSNKHYDRFNLQRLQRVPAGSLHVVALGTSKSLYAMDFDEDFARRIALTDRHVVFHRITASGPEFEDLEPALAALRRIRPDVLLLEKDLLLFDRGDSSVLDDALYRVRQNLIELRERAAGRRHQGDLGKNWGNEDWPVEARCLQRKTPDAMRAYAGFAARWRTTDDVDRAAYLSYLRPMQQAGSRIILVKLPRSPSAEALVPVGLKQQATVLKQKLVETEGFLDWAPDEMPEPLYCDQGHLNKSGRENYSAWLSGQLHALLRKSGV